MLKESVFPLKNPPFERSQPAGYLHCLYCTFITKFSDSLERHKSRYHEKELASEGERARERGMERYKNDRAILLAHGYVECKHWPVPCATKINPLMARICQHTNDCLGQEVK